MATMAAMAAMVTTAEAAPSWYAICGGMRKRRYPPSRIPRMPSSSPAMVVPSPTSAKGKHTDTNKIKTKSKQILKRDMKKPTGLEAQLALRIIATAISPALFALEPIAVCSLFGAT